MILQGQMLNSSATLNQFTQISSLDFMPGSDMDIVFQIVNPELNLRHVLGAMAIVTVTFPTANGTLVKTATFLDPGDKSIVVVSLSTTETLDMSGGNFTFSVETDPEEEDDKTFLGYIQGALRRIVQGEPQS